MEHDSHKPEIKSKETEEPNADELDLQIDDLEGDIIDLVDAFDGEASGSNDVSAGNKKAAEPVEKEEKEFSLEDLDLEVELGDEESGLETTIEGPDDKAESGDATLDAAAAGAAEEVAAETAAATDATAADADHETNEALAELLTSHERDVVDLLNGVTEPSKQLLESIPAEGAPLGEEELPEDLFAGLEEASEIASEEVVSADDSSLAEEGLPEDLFADLGLESADGPIEAPVVAEQDLRLEEELPEDLFADLETDGEQVADEARIVAEASRSEVLSPDAAKELATMVSAHVEVVLARIVEERLPAIVERVIAREIEKLKATMD